MSTHMRCTLRWGILLVLGLTLGCPTEGEEPINPPTDHPEVGLDPLSFPVGERGPFQAGWRGWDVTYVPEGQSSPRTVFLNLWYPTEELVGLDVEYLEGRFPDEEALGDAALAAPLAGGTFPVMVYSHGFQGWGGTSADLCRWFASHGWVVVAPDHTGNTIADHQDPLETAHYLAKPQDLRAMLDALETLPSEDPLAGLADTSQALLTGHSFGASLATWAGIGASFDPDAVDAACAGGGGLPTGTCTEEQRSGFVSGELTDERFVAAIPLAGTIRRSFFGSEGHRTARGPVLSMTGTNDGNPQNYLDQWESIDGLDFTWLSLEGACHQTFALGFCSTLDVAEGFRIVNTYALAFGRAHVLGDSSAEVLGILDGSVSISDAVTFLRKTE